MLKNYFLVAWRSLAKNKISSFINIFGLSVGISVAIFNGLWVWDEFSYNKYHEHYDRIGQVMDELKVNGETGINNTMSYTLALELENHYADNFKHYLIASWAADAILSTTDKKISGTGQYLDAAAPEMLMLKMIGGNRSGLKDPHSI